MHVLNQYEKSTGFSGLKQVFETAANKEGLSQEDYAKKTAAMNAELNQNSALRGKAQMNGAGQTAQVVTAGLYDSVPFLTKSYDPLAAAGTLVGKGMQYNLFNTACADDGQGGQCRCGAGTENPCVGGCTGRVPVMDWDAF